MNALRPPTVNTPLHEMYEMLVVGETRLLRFFFGFTGLAYAAFIMFGAPNGYEYKLAFEAMPPICWAGLLALSGFAILWGSITKRYDYTSLVLEGVVGSVTWMAFSALVMIAQGSLGAITICAVINLFLFVRYPTFQGEKV